MIKYSQIYKKVINKYTYTGKYFYTVYLYIENTYQL